MVGVDIRDGHDGDRVQPQIDFVEIARRDLYSRTGKKVAYRSGGGRRAKRPRQKIIDQRLFGHQGTRESGACSIRIPERRSAVDSGWATRREGAGWDAGARPGYRSKRGN